MPVPFGQPPDSSLDLTVWVSVPGETKVENAIIRSIDDHPLTIVYDQQDKAPVEYVNTLLSNANFSWRGNVLLLSEAGSWSSRMFDDFSWLTEVKATLSQTS